MTLLGIKITNFSCIMVYIMYSLFQINGRIGVTLILILVNMHYLSIHNTAIIGRLYVENTDMGDSFFNTTFISADRMLRSGGRRSRAGSLSSPCQEHGPPRLGVSGRLTDR